MLRFAHHSLCCHCATKLLLIVVVVVFGRRHASAGGRQCGRGGRGQVSIVRPADAEPEARWDQEVCVGASPVRPRRRSELGAYDEAVRIIRARALRRLRPVALRPGGPGQGLHVGQGPVRKVTVQLRSLDRVFDYMVA